MWYYTVYWLMLIYSIDCKQEIRVPVDTIHKQESFISRDQAFKLYNFAKNECETADYFLDVRIDSVTIDSIYHEKKP